MASPFIEALESIRAGGREMLYRPPFLSCAGEVHEPFRLVDQPMRVAEEAGLLEEDRFLPETYLWGTVKTTSWDFTGDRTDLNDIGHCAGRRSFVPQALRLPFSSTKTAGVALKSSLRDICL